MFTTGKEKVLKVVSWLLAIGIAVAILAYWGNVNIKWQEEVRMADGEIFLVDRTAKGRMSKAELSSPWGWVKEEMTLEILKLPANWAPPPIWHCNKEYRPLLIDYQAQEHTWSVVATLLDCEVWKRLGRPALPYVQYQSKNGGPWQVIPLEERLIGRETNLLINPSYKGEPNLVTPEERDKRNRHTSKSDRIIVAVWKENNC